MKAFFKFRNHFSELATIFLNNSGVGFSKRGGGGICFPVYLNILGCNLACWDLASYIWHNVELCGFDLNFNYVVGQLLCVNKRLCWHFWSKQVKSFFLLFFPLVTTKILLKRNFFIPVATEFLVMCCCPLVSLGEENATGRAYCEEFISPLGAVVSKVSFAFVGGRCCGRA